MARKTARKSRKRSRRSRRTRHHRGGYSAKGGVAATASEVDFDEKPIGEEVAAEVEPKQEGGKRKRRRRKSKKRGGGSCGGNDDETMMGGKRKRKSRKGGKRKLNAFFKAMLDAKKSKAKSFSYKGKTYVGKEHKRLGMIYKKK